MATTIAPSLPNRYTCMGCRIKFDSTDLQRDHFKTEWHLYNLKRRVCKLDPVDLDSFSKIQDAQVPIQAPVQKPKHIPAEVDNEEDWEEVDDDDLLDEDYDEEEEAEMLARVVGSNTCLFCGKESSNIKTNLNHMNLLHGFFIPEEQYLIDLEGIMRYLGFKVGAGSTCLWCNKQFTTLHGARLHMLYKDHCKILYDQEKAVDEFKEFYDYSSQVRLEMKPLNQLVINKRRLEKRQERSLARRNQSKELVSHVPKIKPYQARGIKKFDAYRAKILLRTGMANNNTMRGRIRQQNPI